MWDLVGGRVLEFFRVAKLEGDNSVGFQSINAQDFRVLMF